MINISAPVIFGFSMSGFEGKVRVNIHNVVLVLILFTIHTVIISVHCLMSLTLSYTSCIGLLSHIEI